MDYVQHLRDQLCFLDTSCREYDAGHFAESSRMAAILSIICYDSGDGSTSILRRLGKKDILMLSTCMMFPKTWGDWPLPNLTSIEMCSQLNVLDCVPNLGRRGDRRSVILNQWWDEVIFKARGQKVRRRDIIQDARNKDGGAHVDSEHTPRYREMVNASAFQMTSHPDGGTPVTSTLNNAHRASLRQIAYEALHSPELIALAAPIRLTPDWSDLYGAAPTGEAEPSSAGPRSYTITFGRKWG